MRLMNSSERKDLYPHLTPSWLTLTKYIGDVTEIRGPKIPTAYLAHRRPIRSVKKEMRNRRTFCQRMGRSKTHLVDLCAPSTPLFVMLILEEVGSVVDYSTSQRFRPIFAFEERKWLLYVMVWKRVLGWDRYDSKAKAVATRAELRLEVVTRIWLHWIRLMARTFSLLGLELLAD